MRKGDLIMSSSLHATTIFAIRHNGHSAMAGDGQVTLGEQVIMKQTARKVGCHTLTGSTILAAGSDLRNKT